VNQVAPMIEVRPSAIFDNACCATFVHDKGPTKRLSQPHAVPSTPLCISRKQSSPLAGVWHKHLQAAAWARAHWIVSATPCSSSPLCHALCAGAGAVMQQFGGHTDLCKRLSLAVVGKQQPFCSSITLAS